MNPSDHSRSAILLTSHSWPEHQTSLSSQNQCVGRLEQAGLSGGGGGEDLSGMKVARLLAPDSRLAKS